MIIFSKHCGLLVVVVAVASAIATAIAIANVSVIVIDIDILLFGTTTVLTTHIMKISLSFGVPCRSQAKHQPNQGQNGSSKRLGLS